MTIRSLCVGCLFLASQAVWISLEQTASAGEPSRSIEIWPNGKAPGETLASGDMELVTDRRRPFRQYTNISIPTLDVYLAPEEKATGAAILVLPGGGLQRLAMDHEGIEVAEWLNAQGLAAFVLKYRVPASGDVATMDAQRAMKLIRQQADEFGIDEDRLGAIGFSAGGEVALRLAIAGDQTLYEHIDSVDEIRSEPGTIALIYPGGLRQRFRRGRGPAGEAPPVQLREPFAGSLTRENVPPAFLVHAFRDDSLNSLAVATRLKQLGVPCEMHLFAEGGHGFGVRDSSLPLDAWKSLYSHWLRQRGYYDPPAIVDYSAEFAQRLPVQGPLPVFSQYCPNATSEQALIAQKRFVMSRLQQETPVGFKGGATTAVAQQGLGLNHPVTGVLFESGQISADESGSFLVPLESHPDTVVETELGFLISDGADVSYKLTSLEQTKGAIGAIVPVIELPENYARRMGVTPTGVDVLAANAGAARFLLSEQRWNPDEVDLDSLTITLTRDGEQQYQVSSEVAEGGQWEAVRRMINQIIDQGYALHSGDLVLTGSLGDVKPAQPGKYVADYGKLGTIEFEVVRSTDDGTHE